MRSLVDYWSFLYDANITFKNSVVAMVTEYKINASTKFTPNATDSTKIFKLEQKFMINFYSNFRSKQNTLHSVKKYYILKMKSFASEWINPTYLQWPGSSAEFQPLYGQF